jgi:alpha-amylase
MLMAPKEIHSHAQLLTLIFCGAWVLLTGCSENQQVPENKAEPEVLYHVFQRSFYDSNGDGHGDLQGMQQKLGYLQELGVNALLLLPLYESEYYHNYFASDFEAIDKEYGTKQDFLNLVKEAHQRGIKVYMDMETQYVTEDHKWWKDSYGKPASAYTDYIVYNDSGNLKPESIIFDLTELPGYDGTLKKVATVKLLSPKVQEYNYNLFRYWMDPNSDGNFEDGVDGFRLDHCMDDLDWKKKFTNLFDSVWRPLITKLKQVNPKIIFMAEQAEWGSWGMEYYTKAGVDRVFAFRLRYAIISMDKKTISTVADSTFIMTPPGKSQIFFIENHDVERFATAVDQHPGKLKAGAALNMLLGGTPSVYYGQELGMKGRGGFNAFGKTDGNDIPRREAFEWHAMDTGIGLSVWYKNSGPWWDQRNMKANDGISLEEQKKDPNSLWNFYREMIDLKKKHPVLTTGNYRTLKNVSGNVLTFIRDGGKEGIIVAVNLSDSAVHDSLIWNEDHPGSGEAENIYGMAKAKSNNHSMVFDIEPYGVQVWKMRISTTE